MTGCPDASSITDDQLDQLYAELDRLTIARDIAESRAEDWKQAHRVQVGLLDQATARAEAEMATSQAAEARIEAARAHLAAAEDYVHPRHAVEDALQALTAPRP
jgi:hypothetical protein